MRRRTDRRSPRRRPRPLRLLGGVLAAGGALALAGCGERETGGGGRVIGDTLTVVSLMPLGGPDAPAARQMVRGEKLALVQAGGRAGAYDVTFASIDSGGAEPDEARADAATATRAVLSDSQAAAVIGSLDYDTAAVSVPLLDAAGLLHVSPTAGYPGFTRALGPFEPERWYPSGDRSFAPIGGSDLEQAAVMAGAIAQVAGTDAPRVVVEEAPGPDGEAMAAAVAAAVRETGGSVVGSPARADAVVYAGDDAQAARELLAALGEEAPGTPLVLGDDLARTDLPRRLETGGDRRALFVSRAPRPGSSQALREFEEAFETFYGRPPGPYAYLGYEAMRSVLRKGIAAAGSEAADRDEVIAAYMQGEPPPASWSAFELAGGERRYLEVEPPV